MDEPDPRGSAFAVNLQAALPKSLAKTVVLEGASEVRALLANLTRAIVSHIP